MAVSMKMQQRTIATASKQSIAPVARPVARPFSARRPVAAAVRSSEEVARRSSVVVRAAAPAPAAASADKATAAEYYALVCNAEWFFMDPQNESVAEQLREKVRFFKEQNKERDFFIVPNPKWLDAKFPEQAKQVKRPCVALVSTDKMWITFMKLRLDRVLKIDLKSMPASEVLAAGEALPDFKPDGKWTAPYARYTPGWWNVFLPNH
ncbi:hypothetical protein CHLRE_12g490500v5 [Chlamydomonas reinhardtii]|uniref:Uncharacterized protein n=1 Tax=Chlamydomonas reinhardtii TaxID=3055 RepID=A8ILP2_CHLRE|nr:uncharacterized protein CHLRE_12g490500v5 [Chlamydomonas reinhardtii]PNW74609.1 hypothetical protein CHLRE_12g490500v5 [Chlamydomonas reinhardtii]|eukprot:XP_001691121.1 predicted protein [Chlamydomonas reinhardtii]